VAFNLVRSDVGRSFRAIGSDELAAASVGIDVAAYKARVFAISGALAGIAGALYAHFARFISPESFGLDLSILVVVTAVIGGVRSIWGAVVGALFLTGLPELLRVYGQLNQIIYGLVLFLTLLFLPGGLVGGGELLLARLRTAWTGPAPGTALAGAPESSLPSGSSELRPSQPAPQVPPGDATGGRR
jgi:branched-chain amino acid transport system permease protein